MVTSQEKVTLVNGLTHDKWVLARKQFTCEIRVMRFTQAIFNSLPAHY
jgi:hypothetical protein